MYVRSAETDPIIRKNGCDIRQLYPWDDVVTPPWNSTMCTVRPLESSTEHHHATDETFIFLAGRGTVSINGTQERTVEPGDLIYIPNGNDHVVTNTSEHDPLKFISIYWLQPEARA